VTLSLRVSVTGTPQYYAGLIWPLRAGRFFGCEGFTCLPSSQPVSGGNLLRLTRFGHWRELVKCSQ
jgi:hypothetical protein